MTEHATANPEAAPPSPPGAGPDIALTTDPLSTQPPAETPEHGASVQFLGIVRDSEDGRKITGIDYQAYPTMVGSTLAQIAADGREKFGEHVLKLHHRTGFVAAAEPSVVIAVMTRHSQAAFEICQYYLRRLKLEVPIWKRPVFADVEAD